MSAYPPSVPRESPLMADSEKTYTEREVIIRERKAVARMRCAVMHELHFDDPNDQACFACTRRAAEVHPLPSKVVPRVVTDTDGYRWKIENGETYYRAVAGHWVYAFITTERVMMLADLLAHPTETIADDGAPA